MATLDKFRDATDTPIRLDFANTWIADVRLNAGDRDGRTITVELTDNGTPITTSTGISLALAYNTAPAQNLGDRIPMTPVTGTTTATWRATLPRKAIANAGTIVMGIEITQNGTTVCSRNFHGIVERAVYDTTSPDAADTMTRLEQLIADTQQAADNAQQAAAAATAAAGKTLDTINAASITAGTTTTLNPNQKATASLAGTGLKRTLNLGVPRGASISEVAANTVAPSSAASATLADTTTGDKRLTLAVPRGSRVTGVGATTVLPAVQPGVSHTDDANGDDVITFSLPRAPKAASATATTLDTGQEATASVGQNSSGDLTFAFGLPRGEKGENGNKGDKGEQGERGNVTWVSTNGSASIAAFHPAPATVGRLPAAGDLLLAGSTGQEYLVTGVNEAGDAVTFNASPVGNLKGPKGEQGDKGEKGDPGDAGTPASNTVKGVVQGTTPTPGEGQWSRPWYVINATDGTLAMNMRLGQDALPDGIDSDALSNGMFALARASTDRPGIVKVGSGLSVDADGTIDVIGGGMPTVRRLLPPTGTLQAIALPVDGGVLLTLIMQDCKQGAWVLTGLSADWVFSGVFTIHDRTPTLVNGMIEITGSNLNFSCPDAASVGVSGVMTMLIPGASLT